MIDVSKHGFVVARAPSGEHEKVSESNARTIIQAWVTSKFNGTTELHNYTEKHFSVTATSGLTVFETYFDLSDFEVDVVIRTSRRENAFSTFQVFSSTYDLIADSDFKHDVIAALDECLKQIMSRYDSWTKAQIAAIKSENAAAKKMLK